MRDEGDEVSGDDERHQESRGRAPTRRPDRTIEQTDIFSPFVNFGVTWRSRMTGSERPSGTTCMVDIHAWGRVAWTAS
jgi:hypothetical protein